MKTSISYHQERLWFIDTFEAGNLYKASPVYHNIPLLVTLDGRLNEEAFRQCVENVINGHEILHTRMQTHEAQPIQWIVPMEQFELPLVSLAGMDQKNAIRVAIEASRKPFCLETDYLVRGQLFRYADDQVLFLLTFHHLIADHFTVQKVADEIFTAYQHWQSGCSTKTAPVELHYADFAQWQRDLSPEVVEQLLFYWKRQLHGKLEDLSIPTDRPRAAVHIYQEGQCSFSVSSESSSQIRQFLQKQGVSAHDFFLAVYKTLLFRYTGQGEINIGISSDNRHQPGTENLFGPVANLLVTRDTLSGAQSFREVLQAIGKTVKDALDYQDIPFDKLVLEINPQKDMSRTALFDVLFQFEKEPLCLPTLSGLQTQIIDTNLGWGKNDFNLLVQTKEDRYKGILTYNLDYFDASTAQRFVRHYQQLLTTILLNPDQAIATLNFLGEDEKKQLLVDWNQTKASYPEKTIYQLFEEQANRVPNQTALVFEQTKLTYQELNQKANRLGTYLRQTYQIQPNDLVTICLGRSEWMIIGLLGILKAGGAYVPVDPAYPQDRINYILQDSGSRLLLTTSNSKEKVAHTFEGQVVDLFTLQAEVLDNPIYDDAALINTPDDTAYVIYTSGTTGQPKGCMISHRNVVRLLHNDRHPYDFHSSDVWVMAHSFCFDFSVWEMYGALLYGGKLVIPGWETVRDTSCFLQLLRKEGVTVLNQTPRAFYNLIQEESKQAQKNLSAHLRYVIFGGDKLEPSYLQEWVEYYPLAQVQLINMFGITETTVHVTFYRLQDKDITASISPIGGPLPEYSLYILDEALQPVPIGVNGELFVGGTGVAKGYLHKPELTATRFIDHPFMQGEKLYRSGDVGRWLADGSIEYFARKDHQVKIRGYRIEPGEIENQLLHHPSVTGAVVLATGQGQEQCLVGYLTAKENLPVNELRTYLGQFLPEYMIPAFLLQLDAFPLTSNGKMDRTALPDPKTFALVSHKEYVAPANETEQVLTEIYQEVLDKEQIGTNESFFELGGHSLKATQVMSRLFKKYGIKVELRNIFINPTVRGLAKVVTQLQQVTCVNEITLLSPQETYEVSHAQKRLWVLDEMEKGSAAYNMPAAYTIRGSLHIEAFEQAFQALLERHESLRTTFVYEKGEPRQKINNSGSCNFHITHVDLQEEVWAQEKVRELAGEEAFLPFDLSTGPLVRATLLHLHANEYVFLLTLHHIISDGWSMEVLTNELFALYDAFCKGEKNPLPALLIQYKEFAAWQNLELNGEKGSEHQAYWLKKFEEVEELILIPDYPRSDDATNRGNSLTFMVENALHQELQVFSQSQEVSMFMTLLAAIDVLLYRITGQSDITVASPIAGRYHRDLENQVGLYVNTLAFRTWVEGEDSFTDILTKVKETALEGYEHQTYPFDWLIKQLNVTYEEGRSPLTNVSVQYRNHQNLADEQQAVAGLEIGSLTVREEQSKIDIAFDCLQYNDRIRILIRYNTDLFQLSTIENLRDNFLQILQAALADPATPVARLFLLAAVESEVYDDFLKSILNA
jgi:syringomycin synthetase protein SyrE